MNLLQVSTHATAENGGPFRVVTQLHSIFLNDISTSHNQLINFGPIDEELTKFKCISYSTFANNAYGISKKLVSSKFIRAIRTSDLILIHGFYLLPTFMSIYWATTKIEIFLMPHGSLDIYQEKYRKLPKSIFKFLLRYISRNKNITIICASITEQNQINETFSGFKTKVVGIGIEGSGVQIDLTGSINDKPCFPDLIFLGRIHPKKNIEQIIRSISLLKSTFPLVKLTIYGLGNTKYTKKLLDLVVELGLSEFIEFRGFIDGIEKEKRIAIADLFLLPSLNENFAIAVAESIDLLTPVVVSSNVAMSEFVIENQVGVVIADLTDKSIAQAVKDAISNLEEFQHNCYKSRTLLHWDHIYSKWQKVLFGGVY
jgi:glycosyltransferase involved in cell wall biosynthesis